MIRVGCLQIKVGKSKLELGKVLQSITMTVIDDASDSQHTYPTPNQKHHRPELKTRV